MSGTTWQTVTPEQRPDFQRDRFGRPMILQPAGNREAYTRATTFVGAPDDLWNVHRWEKRQVALGLAARPDYVLDVSAHRDDKRRLDEICDRAKEVAGSSAAATRGTAVHAFTELVDQQRELPPGLDAETRACIEAYREAMRPFTIHAIEQHLVNDPLKVAGTTDRVISFRGQRYIADLKTGSTVELGTGKIAGQLAMYARSRPYDVTRDERGEPHGASTQWGLVIHLPAARPGEVALEWVDLDSGWAWVQVARQVREMRKLKFRDWAKAFDPDEGPEPSARARKAEAKAEETARTRALQRERVVRMIHASDSRELILKVWESNQAVWDQGLTDAAKRRIAELEGVA